MCFVYYVNKVSRPYNSSLTNGTRPIRFEMKYSRLSDDPRAMSGGHRSVISRGLPTMNSF